MSYSIRDKIQRNIGPNTSIFPSELKEIYPEVIIN